MKSQKGITLMSLIIYIILLIIILSMLSALSETFFNNTKYITDKGKYLSEYNKFNMYFIEDVKNNKNIIEIGNNKIIFEDGTSYLFANNRIYRNKVKICNSILNTKFIYKEINEKKIIEVEMYIKGSSKLSNEYVLKYW